MLPSGFLSLIPNPYCTIYIDIPVIIAIGWKSAGKTSLIETISGITPLRRAGRATGYAGAHGPSSDSFGKII
jgi:hypothetical protein